MQGSITLGVHFYADGGQIYSSAPYAIKQLQTWMIDYISCAKTWMATNALLLNPTKIEFLWLSTPRSRHLISRLTLTG